MSMFLIEPATSARAACNGCEKKISKGLIRAGIQVPFQANLSTRWFHPTCFCEKLVIEKAARNGSKCYETKEKIVKGEPRVGCPERKGGKMKYISLPAVTSLAGIVQTTPGFDPSSIPGFASELTELEQAALLKALATAVELPQATVEKVEAGAASKRKSDDDSREGTNTDTTATTKKPKTAKAAPSAPAKPDLLRQASPSGSMADGQRLYSLLSWNVDGIRAYGRREKLVEILGRDEAPDLLCIQETKLQPKDEHEWAELHPDFTAHFSSSDSSKGAKNGRSGTAVFVRSTAGALTPLRITCGIADGDDAADVWHHEGRSITVEYETFFVVNLYVLNSGQKLERLDDRVTKWDKLLRTHVQKLEKEKPVVVVGDLNVVHLEIDFWNPKAAHLKKTPGCTQIERDSFDKMFSELGFTDTFRHFHPDGKGCFTWYSAKFPLGRAENKGLRLDYALASKTILDSALKESTVPRLHDAWIENEANYRSVGVEKRCVSDHCPIGLHLMVTKD